MDLTRRTIIITGASRGIGAATARVLATRPVSLALWARTADSLHLLTEELNSRPGVQALAIPVDVTSPEQVHRAAGQTEQHFGRIDILINNAGVGMRSPLATTDISLARQLFAVNFWGALTCIQAVLPAMKRQADGLILNVSSIIGRRALPYSGIYCSSKAALNALSESLRVELNPYNIRVIDFYPGVTRTDFLRHQLTGDASRR
ncbi:MAG: SDR family NAD(P)-dependent oxidoreductase, partial [Caldilineae bacterium]